jgi:hypothetical protein
MPLRRGVRGEEPPLDRGCCGRKAPRIKPRTEYDEDLLGAALSRACGAVLPLLKRIGEAHMRTKSCGRECLKEERAIERWRSRRGGGKAAQQHRGIGISVMRRPTGKGGWPHVGGGRSTRFQSSLLGRSALCQELKYYVSSREITYGVYVGASSPL